MSDDKINISIGSYWHWKHEPELSLIYQGKKGYWHQFALADDTNQEVWCEVSDKGLIRMELDPPKPPTVTISRECAKYIESALQWIAENDIGDWGSLESRHLAEITKSLEVTE